MGSVSFILKWLHCTALLNKIYDGLLKIAEKSNMIVEVMDDKRLPKMHAIFRMFKRAQVVIAPHGAALLNLVFSEPGSLVIEGVCHGTRMVLYYLWEAHTLGQHWHGIPGHTANCSKFIDSPPDEIFRVLNNFLNKTLT